jgi:hypothetical protein
MAFLRSLQRVSASWLRIVLHQIDWRAKLDRGRPARIHFIPLAAENEAFIGRQIPREVAKHHKAPRFTRRGTDFDSVSFQAVSGMWPRLSVI